MQILLIWPPERRSFLSTYRHYSHFGAVAGYLRREYPNSHFKLIDGAVEQLTPDSLASEFRTPYDLVVMQVEPYNLESAQRTIDLCKAVGSSKVIAFGGMCGLNPGFLLAHTAIDAVCYTGNWEYGVRYYIEHLLGIRDPSAITDLIYRESGTTVKTNAGPMVAPEDWCIAPFDWMPVRRYNPLTNANHQHEARILASRGCPFTCSFCRTAYTGTRQVIHRDPGAIVKDIAEVHERYSDDIDKYNLVAANFTANRPWAVSVCRAIQRMPVKIRWCTMSRISLLDEAMVAEMAASGCWKIGLGIETLAPAAQSNINKRFAEKMVEEGVLLLRKYGIVPRTCIMVGIPGQTREDVLYTFLRLQEWGASIRAKEYYPVQQLTSDQLTMETVRRFDRSTQYLNPIDGLSQELFLSLLRMGEVTPDNCRRVISAGVVLLTDPGTEPGTDPGAGRKLLVLRNRRDQWFLPRGKQEPGEKICDTAAREGWEETGIRVQIGEELGNTLDVYWSPRTHLPTAKTTYYFTATALTHQVSLTESEWIEARWVSPALACELLPANTHEIIHRAIGASAPIGWRTPLHVEGSLPVIQSGIM